jgi:hypothetical protein
LTSFVATSFPVFRSIANARNVTWSPGLNQLLIAPSVVVVCAAMNTGPAFADGNGNNGSAAIADAVIVAATASAAATIVMALIISSRYFLRVPVNLTLKLPSSRS